MEDGIGYAILESGRGGPERKRRNLDKTPDCTGQTREVKYFRALFQGGELESPNHLNYRS